MGDPQAVHQDVARLLDKRLVIARRRHPQLARILDFLVRKGELAAVLPGVYARPGRADERTVRAAAACAYSPTAVVVGDAAAALTYWPDLEVPVIDVACRRSIVEYVGFRFTDRVVPPGLIHRRGPVRYSAPALTALDQVKDHGGEGIDRALRSRRATIAAMHEAIALTPHRRGNVDRRLLLLDSRDAPWSEAERLMHRLLREAGIGGWSTNVWTETDGGDYYIDIAFRRSPICIEIDGREFHGADRFEYDRWRGNHLVGAGKIVLRFTWRMIVDQPELVIAAVRRAFRAIAA